MSIPPNSPFVRQLAANGLNGHLVGIVGGTRRPAPPPPAPGPEVLTVTVWVPGLVVRSEANIGGRLGARLRRKAGVKEATRAALARLAGVRWRLPVVVTLHRVGARKLDTDNLAHAMKSVRDVVAELLGVDDGDEAAVEWHYEQSTGKAVGVRVEIAELAAG